MDPLDADDDPVATLGGRQVENRVNLLDRAVQVAVGDPGQGEIGVRPGFVAVGPLCFPGGAVGVDCGLGVTGRPGRRQVEQYLGFGGVVQLAGYREGQDAADEVELVGHYGFAPVGGPAYRRDHALLVAQLGLCSRFQ